MKVSKESMLLYAVSDSRWLNGRTLISVAEAALQNGATFFQLREKHLEREALVKQAKELALLCRRYGVPFVVDDDVEAALQSGADGVHVGQGDLEAGRVRELIGPDRILGVSARTVEQAVLAERCGADYVGVGSVFSTSTKLDANGIAIEEIRRIRAAVSVPLVAIGGINEQNLLSLKGSGADGVAVVSAIFASPDPGGAAKRLAALSREMVSFDSEGFQ